MQMQCATSRRTKSSIRADIYKASICLQNSMLEFGLDRTDLTDMEGFLVYSC